jgi:AmmeMemoRadiSam system protein A
VHRLVELVKSAVEECIRTGRVLKTPEELDEEMARRAGVFVCLKKGGELRWCIGTIEPTTSCVASEAIRNAVGAATEDPRFYPVSEHELDDIEYSVDVLCPPEKVSGIDDLDPRRYGVIVSKGRRRGLLLPDIEGVDTAEKQLMIAMSKAGIAPGEDGVVIERFEVRRFS